MTRLAVVVGMLSPMVARADVAPDPISAVANPQVGILLAIAALVAGLWIRRRRNKR